MKKISLIVITSFISFYLSAQSIKDLDFLIGTWQVREDNKEKNWWEKSTRIGQYVLDSTYIELKASSVSSSGKKRTYNWYIHYNSKKNRFEMVSMFSNWHQVLFDILIWDSTKRKLTIRNNVDSNSNEFHERFGEIVFHENFKEYVWVGENKYGDPDDPSIWKYVEKGIRK